MEEQKLIKRKKKAQCSGNRRLLMHACNELASFYLKHERCDEALENYCEEAEICKDLGLKLEWAQSNRMIGETYVLMEEYDKALKHEEIHLAVAKELENQVEEQRAMASLGRIYLEQGQQSFSDVEKAELCFRSAEKAFMKSLQLCEGLKGKAEIKDIMDMRGRLLLNIGIVLECQGAIDKAVTFIHKAISICANQDMHEVLHLCYQSEALLHETKTKDYAKALACLNKALEVAGRLEDKVVKQCESLAMKGNILCKIGDYQSAKQIFLKAWKLNTPNEARKANIETNLKIVAAICYAEDMIITTDASDHAALKRLQEKIGDGALALKNYVTAVESYLRMLKHAELAGDTGKQLIPSYVSLSQTYKDMGLYEEALRYYEKEYELIKDEPKEAYYTLCNIAEACYLAKKPYEHVEKACDEARIMAAKLGQKYKIRLLKRILQYQELYSEHEKIEDTKAELKLHGYFDLTNMDISDDEASLSSPIEVTTNVGDDICIEDLTDLSENEEEAVQARVPRRRGRGFTIKKNMKGETQLHVACISGNKLLVERLLSSGHAVNVRDNAGWLPIHEACIHGRKEIAEILIDRGAHINDRGGFDCDGITPMYDAACNGHLEIVQLLMDKGAIPSLKTDFGETPLDALQRWRKDNILKKEEKVFYKNLCNKISNYLEKRPAEDLNKSKSPPKSNAVSLPSTSKKTDNTTFDDGENLPIFKRRNIVEEDSFDESDKISDDNASVHSDASEPVITKNKKSGVSEYRSAISALRNRNISEVSNDKAEIKKTKKTSLASS